MKRKIAVVTSSRAEYGLLYWTIKSINECPSLELKLIVTGTHMSPEFGNTLSEIEADGIPIESKVDILISNHSSEAIAKSMGLGVICFATEFQKIKPDILLVLGDRYELLAAVTAALPFNIPIAHISGGESTEGAIDNQVRHAITKMSHLHFPGADIYADNLINLGEESWRIFKVGDPGLENIKNTELLEKKELFKILNIDMERKTFLVTLHPTTLNSAVKEKKEAKEFFETIVEYEDTNIIITYPNSDGNGQIIINELEKISIQKNIRIFKSLGRLKYLSLMKHCELVIGNSSSGLVEAPYMKKAVIDVGSRQKGRLKAENIIHVEMEKALLREAINKALNDLEYRSLLEKTRSIYEEAETSKCIVKILKEIDIDDRLIFKK